MLLLRVARPGVGGRWILRPAADQPHELAPFKISGSPPGRKDWVSAGFRFEPRSLAALLGFPPEARPIAVLCLGHVEAFDPAPRLAIEGWRQPRPLTDMLSENCWPEGAG